MVDRLISLLDVEATAKNFYTSTMTVGGTNANGINNAVAFAADVLAAATAGKDLILKSGTYYIGGDGVNRAIDLAGTIGVRIFGWGTVLKVVSGGATQNALFTITTKSGWVEYDVSAFTHSVTSGGTPAMNTQGEVSTVTLASGPASWRRHEMVSIYSNDPTWYGRADGSTGGDVELNWQHEMSKILSAATTTSLYLAFKTERPFTPSGGVNLCKLRKYNNFGIVFEMYGITLDTDGDPFDGTTYPLATRPKQVFQIYGIESPVIDGSVTVKAVWQGDFAIGYSIGASYSADVRISPNKQTGATTAFLGYCPAWQGPNLKPRVGERTTSSMRHQTTIWSEAPVANISGASVGATTTLTVAYDATSPTSTMQVGDTIHIEGIVGTLSSLNNTKQTITATDGTTSVTFAFNSTGLAWTSGGIVKIMSVGRIYGPTTNTIHYGECVGLVIDGGVSVANSGGIDDEHENAIGSVFRNRSFYGGGAWATEDTSNRAINVRGAGGVYENYDIRGVAQAAQIHSFSQQHNVANTIVFSGFNIRNESNRAGSNALFEVLNNNNANTVTDKRKLVIDKTVVDGGLLTFLSVPVGGPDKTYVKNLSFYGDWGTAGLASKSIFEFSSGELVVENAHLNFTDVTTATYVTRILGGTSNAPVVTFRNVHFENIFSPEDASSTQFMMLMNSANTVLNLEKVIITIDPNNRNGFTGLHRFINVAGVTCKVNMKDVELRNAARLNPTRGLINISTAASVVTGIKDNVRGDAAFAIAGTNVGAGSSYTPTAPNVAT